MEGHSTLKLSLPPSPELLLYSIRYPLLVSLPTAFLGTPIPFGLPLFPPSSLSPGSLFSDQDRPCMSFPALLFSHTLEASSTVYDYSLSVPITASSDILPNLFYGSEMLLFRTNSLQLVFPFACNDVNSSKSNDSLFPCLEPKSNIHDHPFSTYLISHIPLTKLTNLFDHFSLLSR